MSLKDEISSLKKSKAAEVAKVEALQADIKKMKVISCRVIALITGLNVFFFYFVLASQATLYA